MKDKLFYQGLRLFHLFRRIIYLYQSRQGFFNIPEAKQAMYDMKHEVANELGITLNQGYNGELSSKDAGRVGGNMVKNM